MTRNAKKDSRHKRILRWNSCLSVIISSSNNSLFFHSWIFLKMFSLHPQFLEGLNLNRHFYCTTLSNLIGVLSSRLNLDIYSLNCIWVLWYRVRRYILFSSIWSFRTKMGSFIRNDYPNFYWINLLHLFWNNSIYFAMGWNDSDRSRNLHCSRKISRIGKIIKISKRKY